MGGKSCRLNISTSPSFALLAPISFCGAAGEGGRPAQPLFPPSARPDVRLEQLQPAPIPGAKAPVEVPESAPSHAPAGAEQVRFLLTGLSIEGVTAYPQAQIIAIAGGKIDHQVSLADIYGIAAEIQRKYREDGYFLTRVILPPQVIDQGRVRILVLEGFVSGIEIQGDVGPVKALIESYLQHVLAERPLKLATLERNLLLAKDIPGVDVNGILRPSPD
jgi:hemolysin activation/secretion protein